MLDSLGGSSARRPRRASLVIAHTLSSAEPDANLLYRAGEAPCLPRFGAGAPLAMVGRPSRRANGLGLMISSVQSKSRQKERDYIYSAASCSQFELGAGPDEDVPSICNGISG